MKAINEENKNKKFWIHPDDFNTIIAYASSSYNQFKAEIGGQLIAVQDEEGDYILKRPVILKQTVSGGECDIDVDALTVYYSEIAEKFGTSVRHCWWHSHHTMKAFWSGTDNATILGNPSRDWTISLVVNLKKEYKLRIQFFKPFLHEENVELNFLETEPENQEEINAEVKELCSVTQVVAPVYQKNHNVYNSNQIDIYNQGFYNSYAAETHHYNNIHQVNVDFSKIPKKKREELLDEITEVTDDFALGGGSGIDHSDWNKWAKDQNKKLKEYNLKLVTFQTHNEYENATLSYWCDDYLLNLKHNAIGSRRLYEV